ncbi:glycosyltransferase family 4 protein [Rubripirellula reticaptiva]|uniref:Alpha-D-kanosaminyltransferase n=1 Tax=Rubripirellula reticaptiva TaxID=2528013 RepID=A0A5C6F585_9BACT|nr:glycosyltransferase family 4 protein [Rubripirellula reticaptiva]TWU55674.1 Alpha-D-kanosaminyltransferase [Rubripirellula reticaptiva]
MRILYHHRTLGDGAEGVHVAAMIAAFRQLGHQVRVVALAGDPIAGGDACAASGSPTGSVEAYQSGASIKVSSRARKRLSMLASLLPGVAYELAELAYNLPAKWRLKRAVRSFRPDMIYDRYNSFSSAAVDVGKATQTPVFLEVNAPVALERTMPGENRPLRLNRLAKHYERHICQSADRVIVVSTPLKSFLVEERGVESDRVLVLPNGADPVQFDPDRSGDIVRTRYQLGDCTVIGFIGILRRWHGVDLLIDAFGQIDLPVLPHLLIVGDGPIQQDLADQVAAKGLQDRVTFTGRVPHDQMHDYLAAIDIAVSPKATFYASPMKILESMAMGIPTVAADTPNIRDLIADGEDGLLFRPGDAGSLTAAIERLARDPSFARAIGNQARQTIERERNWLAIASEVQAAFDCRRLATGT